MPSCCSNKHYVLSVLRISYISFKQSFALFLCVSAHICHVCTFKSVCQLACVTNSAPKLFTVLRVIHTVLFPSLQASHQSELSSPPLHLSLATFYLAQQVA